MFSVYGWFLEKSSDLLCALKNYGESGNLSNGKAGFSHEQ